MTTAPIPKANPTLAATAWCATLLVSNLPNMFFDQYAGGTPAWLTGAKAALVLALLGTALLWNTLRPLRMYFLMLLALHLAWWGVFTWVLGTPAWLAWSAEHTWVQGIAVIQVMKLAVALVIVLLLWAVFRRREAFFLCRGDLKAPVAPVRWLGVKDDTRWHVFAPIVAAAGFSIMAAVLFLTTPGAAALLGATLALLPVVLLFSATNAVSEELCFRNAQLAPLDGLLGRGSLLGLNALFFGLAHYSGGVPLAMLPTVFMVAFMGFFLGKAMLETKGFGWTWIIHFVNDIPVFFFLALGSIAAAGG